jgi:aspartate/methionine/tyrosine aminotransferase
MELEKEFMDKSQAALNFAESGIDDYTLGEFVNKIKIDFNEFLNLSLGNNNTLGSLELRKEILKTYQTVSEDEIVVTTGVSEAFYIFLDLFIKGGEKVFVLMPAFPPIFLLPEKFKANIFYFDIIENRKNLIQKLKKSIEKEKPDLIIINSPHNPTGFCFTDENIIEISKLSKANNTTVLFDEHYRFLPLEEDKEYTPSLYDVAKKHNEKSFALGSIIKSTGIVGTRIGWLAGDSNFIEQVRDYKDYTTHCVSPINDEIARLAIGNSYLLSKDAIKRIKENFSTLKESSVVKKGKISLNFSLMGGCVYFLKINMIDVSTLVESLFLKYNIFVMPGSALGKDGYIRINLAKKRSDFIFLLESLDNEIK